MPLSPSSVYHFVVDSNTLAAQQTLNEVNVGVSWLWRRTCKSRLICNSLLGNPCGDYGLEVSSSSAQASKVCHRGEIVEGKLSYNQLLKLRLWYAQGAEFQLSCYLWCTDDGELPSEVDDVEIETDLIVAIVSDSDQCQDISR